MLELIKELFDSMMRALIRFWDNRFPTNDDVDWLRMQLEKERAEKVKLLNHILELTGPKEDITDSDMEMDFKPINKGFVPWHVKQQQLENQSRMKARELGHEAKQAIEELEEELGIK